MSSDSESHSGISLQNAAIIQIATSMWNYCIIHHGSTDVYDLLGSISLPGVLKNGLKDCLENIEQWLRRYCVKITGDKLEFTPYSLICLQQLVWGFDGFINYSSTTEKLFQGTYLSKLEKCDMAQNFSARTSAEFEDFKRSSGNGQK